MQAFDKVASTRWFLQSGVMQFLKQNNLCRNVTAHSSVNIS